MEDTKVISIKEQSFQIARMSPRTACLIRNWLLFSFSEYMQSHLNDAPTESPTMEKDPQEKAENVVGLMWLLSSNFLSEETLTRVQTHCLKVCAYRDEALSGYLPVTMTDGRWAASSVMAEKDAVGVDTLITESLKFNLSPFFVEGASKEMKAS